LRATFWMWTSFPPTFHTPCISAIACEIKFILLLSCIQVFYSREVSVILHSLPIAIFFLVPLFLKFPNITLMSWSVTLLDFIRGMWLKCSLKKFRADCFTFLRMRVEDF
jgi:hypothetical protein